MNTAQIISIIVVSILFLILFRCSAIPKDLEKCISDEKHVCYVEYGSYECYQIRYWKVDGIVESSQIRPCEQE